MSQEPYRSAKRFFWIFTDGSSHRGQKCVRRLRARWPSIIPVQTAVHASWLNQVESYFSVVQRKVLSPNDFDSLPKLEAALLCFQERYKKIRHCVPRELHRRGWASRAPSCGRLTRPRPCVTLIPNGNTKLAYRVSRKPQKRCHPIDARRQKRVSMGGRVQKGVACVSMSGGD